MVKTHIDTADPRQSEQRCCNFKKSVPNSDFVPISEVTLFL